MTREGGKAGDTSGLLRLSSTLARKALASANEEEGEKDEVGGDEACDANVGDVKTVFDAIVAGS